MDGKQTSTRSHSALVGRRVLVMGLLFLMGFACRIGEGDADECQFFKCPSYGVYCALNRGIQGGCVDLRNCMSSEGAINSQCTGEGNDFERLVEFPPGQTAYVEHRDEWRGEDTCVENTISTSNSVAYCSDFGEVCRLYSSRPRVEVL